jgi:sulfoacetaldehyde acetyltransferase
MIIFRNYQWGAEKRNTTLWFDDNFVGTELNLGVNTPALPRLRR